MTRENEILDSLEHFADSLGLGFKVYYCCRTKSDLDSLPLVDSLMLTDTCEIKGLSGVLEKNEVVYSGIDLYSTGWFSASAYCTLYTTGSFNALNYSVYHNLVFSDNDSYLSVLTGINGNYLSQGDYQGAASSIMVGYANSEYQANKHWVCHFNMVYQEYSYQGFII